MPDAGELAYVEKVTALILIQETSCDVLPSGVGEQVEEAVVVEVEERVFGMRGVQDPLLLRHVLELDLCPGCRRAAEDACDESAENDAGADLLVHPVFLPFCAFGQPTRRRLQEPLSNEISKCEIILHCPMSQVVASIKK